LNIRCALGIILIFASGRMRGPRANPYSSDNHVTG
jgi:hypothetical protein